MSRGRSKVANRGPEGRPPTLRAINADLLAALKAIQQFCDDPQGSQKRESLAMGMARLLPFARAAIAKATGGGNHAD